MTTGMPQTDLHVAVLTAGKDKPYAYGVATALRGQGVRLDLVAGDELDLQEFHDDPGVSLMMFRREPKPGASFLSKAAGVLRYYLRLIGYAWSARPTVFHILWNNKFETFDRVALMLFYRMLGKRVVLTAHNVNTATRDATDTAFNRVTLKFQYRLCDHIFVHTEAMKEALVASYGVSANAVTVIPFGINNAVPHTALTEAEARQRLGIPAHKKTILFFGNIAPYKGLEYLVDAFRRARVGQPDYHLIVTGRPKKGFEDYWEQIKASMTDAERAGMTLTIEFVPDEDTEVYFKAADVLALPYTSIFQSGVLFLGYSFGLPVLAADVGSLREEIIEGRTGSVFAAQDVSALVTAIETYFGSELYRDLANRRSEIKHFANEKYSWDPVARTIRDRYATLPGATTEPAHVIVTSQPRR